MLDHGKVISRHALRSAEGRHEYNFQLQVFATMDSAIYCGFHRQIYVDLFYPGTNSAIVARKNADLADLAVCVRTSLSFSRIIG
jgi:hypothetical protein